MVKSCGHPEIFFFFVCANLSEYWWFQAKQFTRLLEFIKLYKQNSLGEFFFSHYLPKIYFGFRNSCQLNEFRMILNNKNSNNNSNNTNSNNNDSNKILIIIMIMMMMMMMMMIVMVMVMMMMMLLLMMIIQLCYGTHIHPLLSFSCFIPFLRCELKSTAKKKKWKMFWKQHFKASPKNCKSFPNSVFMCSLKSGLRARWEHVSQSFILSHQ